MSATAIATHIAQIRHEVELLAGRSNITALVHRLGACLDEGDFDRLRSLFVEDVTAKTPGGEATGLDAVVAQATRNHSRDERIQHRITDVLIDLDGDRASVRANLNVTFSGEPGAQFSLGAVYRFDAVRTPAGWRFARLEVVPVWTSGTRSATVST